MDVSRRQRNAILAYIKRNYWSGDVESLIKLATRDLYEGPVHVADGSYPGFAQACDRIREALPRCDLWVSLDGDVVSEQEPDWHDENGEPQECPDDYTLYPADVVKRVLAGALAEYL